MFGFSRGAYTVRALAGMLHKVGLLPRDNLHHAPFAYKMFRRNDSLGFTQSAAFKRSFTPAREVEIEFMGLWDTVSSVGVLKPRRLPFTSSNSTVRTFRHALALDERRSRFRPTLWAQTHLPSADRPVLPPKTSTFKTQLDRIRRKSTVSAPATAPGSPVAPNVNIIASSQVQLPSIQGTATTTGTGGRSPPPAAHVDLPPNDSPDRVLRHDTAPTGTDQPLQAEPVSLPENQDDKPTAPPTEVKHGRLRSLLAGMRWRPRKRRSTREEIERELGLEREFDEATANEAERWRAHAGSPSSPGRRGRRTDVNEVWFAGGHCDVGGGNDPDAAPHMLSNIPLHWMLQEAVRAQAGILWDHGAFSRSGMPLGAFGLFLSPGGVHHRVRQHHISEPHHRHHQADSALGLGLHVEAASDPVTPSLSRAVSREDRGTLRADPTMLRMPRGPTTSTLQLNLYGPDALSPMRDELKALPFWWMLELVPAVYWYQQGRTGHWRRTTRPNVGRPRKLPDGARVHESVKQRMITTGYVPASWREDAEVEWVF